MVRLELRVREDVLEGIDPAGVVDGGGAAGWEASDESFRLGASQFLWMVPAALRVATKTVLRAETDGMRAAERSVRRRLVRYGEDDVAWVRDDDELFRPVPLFLERYEAEAAWHRQRVEWLEDLIASGARGWKEAAEVWGGESNLRWLGEDSTSPERRVFQTSLEPGVSWEIVVRPLGSSLPAWAVPSVLSTVLDLPIAAAKDLAGRLEGDPISFVARSFPVGESSTRLVYDRLGAKQVALDPAFFEIPALDRRAAETAEGMLDDPAKVAAALVDPERNPGGWPDLLLIRRLEAMPAGAAGEALAELWRELDEPFVRVEVGRALLRRTPDVALEILRSAKRGESGEDAIRAAEVLVLEKHPEALDFVGDLLVAPYEWSDLAVGTVETWSIRELRVLSGLDLAELEGALAAIDAIGPDEDALFREFQFWTRWLAAR